MPLLPSHYFPDNAETKYSGVFTPRPSLSLLVPCEIASGATKFICSSMPSVVQASSVTENRDSLGAAPSFFSIAKDMNYSGSSSWIVSDLAFPASADKSRSVPGVAGVADKLLMNLGKRSFWLNSTITPPFLDTAAILNSTGGGGGGGGTPAAMSFAVFDFSFASTASTCLA